MDFPSNTSFKTITLTMSLLVTACGGGSSDTTPPTVSSVTPVDAATAVDRTTAVTATFNENMLATSIDTTSFTLANSSTAEGVVTFDGSKVATFTPTNSLALMSTYTATLSTANTDLSGNALASNHPWSFTTADGAWGSAENIDQSDNSALTRRIAVDINGNAFAVWRQNDGSKESMFYNRYEAATGWAKSAALLEKSDGTTYKSQVAFDSNGNAIAVWYQENVATSTMYSIYAKYYTVSTSSWGDAARLETIEGRPADIPQIAFDTSGNAIAVWNQDVSGAAPQSIYANYYSASTSTWGGAILIETSTGDANNQQIAFDPSGNAIVVWHQDDGVYTTIYANRYTASTSSWSGATDIDESAGNAIYPRISTDASGNAIVVWEQLDGAISNIKARRYKQGDGWGSITPLESGSSTATVADIGLDASGNAMAVWLQDDGTNDSIYANRYVADTGWGTAELIETAAGIAGSPKIAMDPSGNAITVWHQHDGVTNSIYANRYVAGIGWDLAGLIENSTDSGSAPQIAMNASGTAFTIWRQPTTDIWVNQFK